MGNGLITQDERESEVYKKWLKESRKKAVAKKMGKKEKWESIGAGRVGDKYKGGIIKEIDSKNAKAKVKYD